MLNFQPQRPQAVQSGSHTQPQGGGGGFNFWDALGGAGQGYLQDGWSGALQGFAGNAFDGGGGGQTAAPTTTNAPTSSGNNQALQSSDSMMLQSQNMTPGLGQDMNSMAPENRIGGDQSGMQNADTMARMASAMADPYINPHLWEL